MGCCSEHPGIGRAPTASARPNLWPLMSFPGLLALNAIPQPLPPEQGLTPNSPLPQKLLPCTALIPKGPRPPPTAGEDPSTLVPLQPSSSVCPRAKALGAIHTEPPGAVQPAVAEPWEMTLCRGLPPTTPERSQGSAGSTAVRFAVTPRVTLDWLGNSCQEKHRARFNPLAGAGG